MLYDVLLPLLLLAPGVVPAIEAASNPFTQAVEFLKAGGPLAVAVIAGYWAWRKDGEKNDIVTQFTQERKEMHQQFVALMAAQTAASVEMRGAIAALKDAIERLVASDQRRGG